MDRNTPKPKGLHMEYASQFKDSSVAAAYSCRPTYPDATFPMLAELVVGRPRRVLDVGCGTGFVARPLVAYVDWVDAVDFSAPMLEIGRTLPNGDHPNLRWIHGAVEEVDLDPPYGLITAGSSLHWMEWSIVMPRFHRLLTPGGFIVLVGMSALSRVPWWSMLLPLIQRYSTNRDFQPYDTVAELTARDLFSVSGQARTEPMPISQTVVDYIESLHARNGLSRERMQPDAAAAFDAAATKILTPYAVDGMLHWQNQGTLVWGKPDPNP